ncbi:CotO family spore coat protein [Heyndrickxia sporothermodurans]
MSTSKDHYEKRKPLLYIIQPESKPVSVNMQTTFSSKISTKESETMEAIASPKIEDDSELNTELDNENDRGKEINGDPVNEDEKIKGEQIEGNSKEVPENGKTMHTMIENSPQRNTGYQRRSFREMNVTEKIYFLVNKPGYIPRVIVEIQTEDNNYTGVVLNYRDGIVVFDQLKMGEHPIQLNEAEIKDIKIFTK